jgi:hypothetical protein
MKNKKDVLGSLQSVSLFVAYLFVVLMLFLAGWYGLGFVVAEPGALLALYVILFLLCGGLLGAWLWVLIKIPQGIAREYDAIKNQIAGGEIANSADFSKALAKFLVEYFSFFRFDVVAVQVKIKSGKPFHFPGDEFPVKIEAQTLTEKSRETEGLVPLGKIAAGGQSLHGYLVPIWFGNEWLGYFCVFTDTKLIKIFRGILETFEEQYVDDQLMHVINSERRNND